MKNILFLIGFILISVGFFSCEKEIEVPLQAGEKKLVVEGYISNGNLPYVYLTKSIGFFDNIDLSAVEYATGAACKVTDLVNNQAVLLKQYNIDTTVNGQTFKFVIYGPDINDPNALLFKGIVGHYYKLDIDWNGSHYEAVTTIAENPGLDSLWMERLPEDDNYRTIHAIYDDPDTIGNSVSIETQRRSPGVDPEPFLKPFNSEYDDEIINGTRLPIEFTLGIDGDFDVNDPYRVYAKKGDTITIKWSAIDKPVYRFWQTLSFSENSVGNPFASPTQVQTNIKGDAYGIWAGYHDQYYTIVDTLQ